MTNITNRGSNKVVLYNSYSPMPDGLLNYLNVKASVTALCCLWLNDCGPTRDSGEVWEREEV